MDEQPVQLVRETRPPMAATKNRPRRVDYEYERAGTAAVFLFSEPLAGWRQATGPGPSYEGGLGAGGRWPIGRTLRRMREDHLGVRPPQHAHQGSLSSGSVVDAFGDDAVVADRRRPADADTGVHADPDILADAGPACSASSNFLPLNVNHFGRFGDAPHGRRVSGWKGRPEPRFGFLLGRCCGYILPPLPSVFDGGRKWMGRKRQKAKRDDPVVSLRQLEERFKHIKTHLARGLCQWESAQAAEGKVSDFLYDAFRFQCVEVQHHILKVSTKQYEHFWKDFRHERVPDIREVRNRLAHGGEIGKGGRVDTGELDKLVKEVVKPLLAAVERAYFATDSSRTIPESVLFKHMEDAPEDDAVGPIEKSAAVVWVSDNDNRPRVLRVFLDASVKKV